MQKKHLIISSASLLLSSTVFAHSLGDNLKALENTNQPQITREAGMVNFPTGILGGSGAQTDWRFSAYEFNVVKNSMITLRKPSNYDLVFRSVSAGTNFDPILLRAFAATESGLGQKVTGSISCPVPEGNPIYARGKNYDRCVGLYQLSASYLYDVMTKYKPHVRVPLSSYQERYDPTIGGYVAAVGIKYLLPRYLKTANEGKPAVGKYGFPYNNMVNVVRAYNGGAGNVASRLKGTAGTANSHYKENFQYAYKMAMFYYGFGGSSPYFVDLLSGKDEYLAAQGVSAGQAQFDGGNLGSAYNVQPYTMPNRQCTFESPVESNGKILVNNPFGERYDYDKRIKRFNTTLDLNLPVGTPVLSMADNGRVIGVKTDDRQGTVLQIDFGKGVISYGSLQRITVKSGEIVKAGQVIGYSGDQNAYKTPLLMLGYFPDSKGNLSTEENNQNISDPLAIFCKPDVDIPEDMLINAGALPQMVTDVKTEIANSLSGAIEAMVKDRMGNKQWLADLSSMSEPRLYAEYAYQQMIDSTIRQRNSNLAEKMNTYNASELSLIKESVIDKKQKSTSRQDIFNN